MIHFLGVLFLSLAVTFCGIYPSLRLTNRRLQLELSISCIGEMREMVRYSGANVKCLTETMQKKYGQLEWLWKKQSKEETYCTGREFLEGFGKGDTASQLNYCDMYISKFNKCLSIVEKEKETKTRLYISLGAMLGMSVFVLLI